jgi:hypothetical protein
MPRTRTGYGPGVDDSRRQSELDALERRFLMLMDIDQREFCRWVEEYLRLDDSLFDDEGERQNETLDCIHRAARHLGLTRPPTVVEYQEAARALNLDWSWQQIHRLWGSFAVAAGVAFGAKRPRSAQQRAFMTRYGGRYPAVREEYLEAVRIWVATGPPKETGLAYDDFAREYNYTLDDCRRPLPRCSTIRTALALAWREIVAIARGEEAHPEVVRKRRQGRDRSRGPHDLISLGTIARGRAIDR